VLASVGKGTAFGSTGVLQYPGGLYTSPGFCRASKAVVPLAAGPLPRIPFTLGISCRFTSRLVIRVRMLQEAGKVIAAYLAVRTVDGRPVAYIQASARTVLVYGSSSCHRLG
jgi:hypothetical protein